MSKKIQYERDAEKYQDKNREGRQGGQNLMRSRNAERGRQMLSPRGGLWDPSFLGSFDRPFMNMRRLFDTFFDDMLTPFAGFPTLAGLPTFGGRGFGAREMIPERGWPRVDVTEDQNNVFVYADLPGIDEKDLDVSVEEDRIIIRGEKHEETEESNRDYYYHERGFGSFERVLPLPVEVRGDAAQATFRNGLLTVTLPKEKQQSLNRRQIPISTGERGVLSGRQGEERRERERELV